MDIFFDRKTCDFFWRCKQCADFDVEADIAESRGDDFLAPVMAILPHLGNENGWRAAIGLLERRNSTFGPLNFLAVARGGHVNTLRHPRLRHMAAPNLLQRQRNFTNGRFGPRRVNGGGQQVSLASFRNTRQAVQHLPGNCEIPLGSEPVQLFNLACLHGRVVNPQDINFNFIIGLIFVHAHNSLFARVNAGLGSRRRLFNPHLGNARFNGFGHASELFNFRNMRPCPGAQVNGELFHEIAAAPWINHPAGACLLLQKQLRVAGDPGGKIRGQGQRLVKRICVQ